VYAYAVMIKNNKRRKANFDFSPIAECPLGCQCLQHSSEGGQKPFVPLTREAVLMIERAAKSAKSYPHDEKPKSSSSLEKMIQENDVLYLKRLSEIVSIKSVSADPTLREDTIAVVFWAQRWCKRLGAKTTLYDLGLQDKDLPLPPILCATFGNDPKKKTILCYAHLDVQPASKSDGWNSEPFEMEIRDGKCFGRGTTDDKGPALCWLNAIEALQQKDGELPVNVKLLMESMEECGSLGAKRAVRMMSKRQKFLDPRSVDFVCISDNYWTGPKKPCLTYGLRGLCHFSLTVECSEKDLHSGVIGGSVHEAMTDLIRLLSTLVDTNGKILIEGINRDVKSVTKEERERYRDIDFDLETYRKDVGVSGDLMNGDSKTNLLMHRWRFPTLSIHGIEGAYSGAGAKTVIPGKVIGKFSIRLVPDMTPETVRDKVYKHIEKEWQKLKSPNHMSLKIDKGSMPWVCDPDGQNFQAAARACKTVFGTSPDMTREGGSIPITLEFANLLGKEVVLLPIGACDDMAHSQNEKINVRNYVSGIRLIAEYMKEISKIDEEDDGGVAV
jgi:cytosolic nonspecific dipeptidase